MGDRRRTNCNVCGKHRDEVGEISWSGNCLKCALAKVERVTMSLHTHTGEDFARWRTAHAAAVGAVFPSEELLPGVERIAPNQQRNQRKSKRWGRLSDARLAFAEGQCEVKLPGCRGEAVCCHLNPALGGNHRLARFEDIRAVCAVCHGFIHARVTPAATLAALDDDGAGA